jgi:hypothetical protein
MKSKQLANVLIKVLGLSMCLYQIPSFFSDILMVLTPLWVSPSGSSDPHSIYIYQAIANAFSFAVHGILEFGLGIFVIIRSRMISEFLFKNEEE